MGQLIPSKEAQGVSMLPVVETFHSVQGEGFWSGTNAYFIRLAGCDVGCSWCDTSQSWSTRHPSYSISGLVAEVKAYKPAIVVITGGEPLMHDLTELTESLGGVQRHLETSGVYPLTGEWDWITLSPKPHKPPQASILDLCDELKVVIASEQDFEFAEQMRLRTPERYHYLQPCWGNGMEQAIVDYVLKNPHWRISLQTHKLLKVR